MVSQILTKLTKSNDIKVAILGHRGIPCSYGGFENFAEHIAEKLVDFGVDTTAYCRQDYFTKKPTEFKGIKLIYLPALNNKSLETLSHSFLSILHLIFKNTANTVLLVNVGNAPMALLARIFGKKVILCVDGLDWERKKWGRIARIYLKACSYLARFAAHEIVTDATSVQEFYKEKRGARSTLIPYGSDIENINGPVDIKGLENKKYFVYIARFEPENNPLKVVQAYVKSGCKMPLVMVGDNRYNQEYVKEIKRAANSNVLFLGYIFGKKYKKVLKNALAYIRAAEVGGASPAIIDAMGKNVCILANDKPENREIVDGAGFYYDLDNENELVKALKNIEENPEQAIELGKKGGQRTALLYSWDKITYEYLKLINRLNLKQEKQAGANNYAPQTGKPRILFTGAGGMLGQAMYKHYSKNYEVLATDIDVNEEWLEFLDVRDSSAYEKMVKKFKPNYIFHLPALTSLEECEQDKKESYLTNALATKYGAQLSKKYNAKFIYISSAGVFDGEKKYYTDDEEPNPVNTYGLTKQLGALYAKFYAKDALVLRPGWMIGGGPRKDKKFVNIIISQILAGKKEIFVVNDKFGTPTYTHDLAKQSEILIQNNKNGTYNTVCSGFSSRLEVAKEIIKILGYEGEIKLTQVNSDFFKEIFFAKRPKHENLVNKKLINENLNVMRTWQNALKEYLEHDFAHAFKNQSQKTAVLRTAGI